jgi:hypothetical protein
MPSQANVFPDPQAAGAFTAFLTGSRGPGSRRSWSLLAAVALHVVAAASAVGVAAWKVEELETKEKVIITFNPVTIPPLAAQPAPPAVKANEHRRADPLKPSPRVRPRHQPSAIPPTAPSAPTVGPATDTGDGDGPGTDTPCPPGASCSGLAAPARMLPPQVGEKRCLSCPLPRLPPAFRQLGAVLTVLARICADATGRTTKVDILRGLGGDVDQQIAAVLAAWRFAPLQLDGRPVPFCYVSRFVFSTK